MIFADHEVLLFTPGGSKTETLILDETKAGNLYFHGEDRLILCDDGYVYRYDKAGTMLDKISLTIYSGLSSDIEYIGDDPMGIFWEETNDGDLILSAFGAGNIIDCEEWGTKAFVPYLQAYCAQTDTFFCAFDGRLGTFRRVSTEEMVRRAREELNVLYVNAGAEKTLRS